MIAETPKLAKIGNSWDANWATSWDPSKPCSCVRQTYQGVIPAYDPISKLSCHLGPFKTMLM